jgi:hypothetical protein
MLTEWQRIRSFPGYSVSDTGFVRNDETGRELTYLRNQSGVVHVGLTKNKVQFKRSVALLVADAFLVPPMHRAFDTPIHLDGVKSNNNVENLLWRPRWFANKYALQFGARLSPDMPVEELNTAQKFENTFDAAITYGLLERDIRVSVIAETEVWPTRQRFRSI